MPQQQHINLNSDDNNTKAKLVYAELLTFVGRYARFVRFLSPVRKYFLNRKYFPNMKFLKKYFQLIKYFIS